MNKTILWSALALVSLAGCQQPYRCGARDEPCCNFEGVAPCIADLGLSCNAGVCTGAARTSCPVPGGRCDIGLQNCSSGEGCQTSGNTSVCSPAGTGAEGAPCANETQCAPGYYCSTAGNVCRRYCCGDTGCAARQICISGDVAGSNAGLCIVSNCDLVAQTGCVNSSCYPVLVDGSVTSLCLATGDIPVGDLCATSASNCVPGAACFGDTCREMCRPSSPACSSGTCTPTPDADDLGACL